MQLANSLTLIQDSLHIHVRIHGKWRYGAGVGVRDGGVSDDGYGGGGGGVEDGGGVLYSFVLSFICFVKYSIHPFITV
ncbi:Hypothetical predicted protein [Octopus vulgaris]|uniref:Uncharacterized protein n=1 Tax=Octopus vulgaris TaxID=6645 RepID=A0AA36B904_OCTVU|nr:Hypothetical predicted protein [Octopus vulgaris]